MLVTELAFLLALLISYTKLESRMSNKTIYHCESPPTSKNKHSTEALMIECPICFNEYKQISNSHIAKHGMSVQEFRRQYPLTQVGGNISCTSIMNYESSLQSYNTSPNVCKFCSSSIPYDKRKNSFCSQSCAASHNNTGKSKSPETKLKIRHTQQSNRNTIPAKTNIHLCKCIGCSKSFYSPKMKKCCSLSCLSLTRSNRAKVNPKLNGNHNRHSGWYDSPIAGRVYLESSWELKLAKLLDAESIPWLRPSFLQYNDGANKYFPDFFISNHNIYIDPKNPYKLKSDMVKLTSVVEAHNINLLIITNPSLISEQLIPMFDSIRGLVII